MNIRKVIEENKILSIMRNIPFEQTLAYAEAVIAGGKIFVIAVIGRTSVTLLSK